MITFIKCSAQIETGLNGLIDDIWQKKMTEKKFSKNNRNKNHRHLFYVVHTIIGIRLRAHLHVIPILH